MLRITLLLAALLLAATTPSIGQDSSSCEHFQGKSMLEVYEGRNELGYWLGRFYMTNDSTEQHLFLTPKEATTQIYVLVFLPPNSDPFSRVVEVWRREDDNARIAGIDPSLDYMHEDELETYKEFLSDDRN